MKDDITLEHIVRTDILTCTPSTPLAEAARRMASARCSSILVELEDEIIGIWTERDALAMDMSSPDMFQAPISDYMSSPVKTIQVDVGLGEAAVRLREEKVRHFLVVDGAGERCGIVTQTDVVNHQGVEYYLSLRPVTSVLNEGYPTVASDVPLDRAVSAMRAGHLDAILVSYPDGGRGILTESDVVQLIADGKVDAAVGELASRPVLSVGMDSSLYHARQLFVARRIRHLGVTDGQGGLKGLVTFADILANIENDYVRQLREALRDRERTLELSEQHLKLAAKVFESTLEGIMITNAFHAIESVNPAFTQITGYKAHEVVGKKPAILSSGRHDLGFYEAMQADLDRQGHWQGEIWNRRKNGEIYPEWLTISTVRGKNGEISNYVGVFSDISKRKAAEDQMHYLAYHDGLTGLPNRGLFMDRLEHAIAHAHRSRRQVAVMFLDLDKFKPVNDTLGHHVGDQLLQMVAQRLSSCVREGDSVARLGGDEFAVALESVGGREDVALVVEKILERVSQPVEIHGHALCMATSIGIAMYPDDGLVPADLLQRADVAMYASKKSGAGRYSFAERPGADSLSG